ncbi:fumarylacetoacetate hydrolase family protein, partial [Agromyces terreus]
RVTAAAAFAAALDRAQRTASPIAQLTAEDSLDLGTAYATQHALVARRLARGEQIVGVKLGFTSRAKAQQMGVDDVIIGTLTDGMRLDDGGVFERGTAIHPRVEPEVAFLLGADVDDAMLADPSPGGPSDSWPASAAAGLVAAVAPALEIIDSRYRDFRFSLGEVVADNASSAAFAIGAWQPTSALADLALDNRAVTLEIDDRLAATGSTAAILGDPVRAIATTLRLARAHGFPLRAGTVLLAGAATVAQPVPHRGILEASITGLGTVSLRVEPGEHPANVRMRAEARR